MLACRQQVRLLYTPPRFAGLVKLAAAAGLNPADFGHGGSSPPPGTRFAVVVEWQTRQLEGLVRETGWRFDSSQAHQVLRKCRNGSRARLRTVWWKHREGSTPSFRTNIAAVVKWVDAPVSKTGG